MVDVYPDSVPVLGNVNVRALITMSNRTAPTVASINSGTGTGMSCAFMADGWKPTTTQSKSNKMRRLCSKADTERLNPAQHSIGTLMWSEGDPQDPDTDITDLMVEGALIYFVERHGIDVDDAYAATQVITSHYVRLGTPYRVFDPSADNGEFYRAAEVEYVDNGPIDGVIAA